MKHTVQYLLNTLDVTTTMLAAQLEISEKTLVSWTKMFKVDFLKESKGQRLVLLSRFVDKSLDAGIPNNNLLALLSQPIDESNEESPSIMYYIIDEPNSERYDQISDKLIADWRL